MSNLLSALRTYYVHQFDLMQWYIKDQKQKEEYAVTIKGWIDTIDQVQKQVQEIID